jgi:F plasmid transfer operon protein TraF
MANRRRALVFLLLAAGLFASARPVRAQFPWAGARAVGMGGAQVAAVDDGTAAWSNPAALGRLEGWGVQVFGSGLAANRNNLVGIVDSLSNLPFEEIASGDRLDLLPELVSDLETLLQPDTSVIFSGVGAIAAHYKGFSLSVGTVPYAGIYPVIDFTHIVPGGGPNNGLDFNDSGLYLVGLNAREVRLAYGLGFLGNTVLVGGAARLVFGRTYFTRCGVFDCENKDIGDLVNDAFKENALSSTEFAFDLGAEVNLGIFRFGVVGTSLNEPNFDVAVVPGAPATVPLPRQIRGGVAVTPLPFLTLAADGDFLKSDTLAPGAQSQQLSLGAEFRIPLFAFRAGGFRDFAATQPHWAYSVGVGLRLPAVAIDASVLLSPQGGLDPTDLDREDLGAGASVRVHF